MRGIRSVGHENGPPRWDRRPHGETRRPELTPSARTAGRWPSTSQRAASPETSPAGAFILGFQPPDREKLRSEIQAPSPWSPRRQRPECGQGHRTTGAPAETLPEKPAGLAMSTASPPAVGCGRVSGILGAQPCVQGPGAAHGEHPDARGQKRKPRAGQGGARPHHLRRLCLRRTSAACANPTCRQ